MTRQTITTVLLTTMVVAAGPTIPGQKRQAAPAAIREVKNAAVASIAPRECLNAFRDFFSYLQRVNTNIVRDDAAQKRGLSAELRKSLALKVATFSSPADDPDFPGNGTFVGSWDYPTT